MNGWKPVIFLEEAGVEYQLTWIDFAKREQKSAWYLKLNHNGRIPTIVDRGNGGFVVFESGAILWYLAEKYDRFLPAGHKARSQALQWLMFQLSAIGPMMGQAMYFQRIAEPLGHRDEFAITRYVNESRRLLEVLDRQLAGKSFLLGDEYGIADMASYPWARSHAWAEVDVQGLNNLNRSLTTIDARPAVRRALQIPEPFPAFFGDGDLRTGERENSTRFRSDVTIR